MDLVMPFDLAYPRTLTGTLKKGAAYREVDGYRSVLFQEQYVLSKFIV